MQGSVDKATGLAEIVDGALIASVPPGPGQLDFDLLEIASGHLSWGSCEPGEIVS